MRVFFISITTQKKFERREHLTDSSTFKTNTNPEIHHQEPNMSKFRFSILVGFSLFQQCQKILGRFQEALIVSFTQFLTCSRGFKQKRL